MAQHNLFNGFLKYKRLLSIHAISTEDLTGLYLWVIDVIKITTLNCLPCPASSFLSQTFGLDSQH